MCRHTALNLVFLGCACSATALFAGPVDIVPGRVLLRPAANVSEEGLEQILRGVGGQQVDRIAAINVRIIKAPVRAQQRALAALQKNPHIEFAEPDYILAPDGWVNDVYYPSQWHLPAIHAPAAWDLHAGSSTLAIAVIDTGVEPTHGDLALKLLTGWNFYDGNSNTADVNGHGTAVAGTVAASANNAIGVASVAPNCAILPIRVTDSTGLAYESTIAKALTWAADKKARVANISFRASNSSTIKSAAQYFQSKGGVVVISAGNEGLFDSAADNPHVLTVSATDSNDSITSWSNTGNNVDVAAPGLHVLTTAWGNGYAYWSGTSFSAPIVAGAAALVISAQPGLTGAQAADIIKGSADDRGAAGWDSQYGWGRVNVERAVASALNTTVPAVDSTPPSIAILLPIDGSKVSRKTDVYVHATDDRGVKKVELYVDGRYVTASTAAPFTTSWNSQRASSGAHRLQTKAYDAAGNWAWSSVVTVYK